MAVLALLCFLGAGCTGYKLGPVTGANAGERSIRVQPFKNQTLEPRLPESVGMAMRKALQQDGTYRLETRGDSDIVLSGVIRQYLRQGLSYSPLDTLTVRDYTIYLIVDLKAVERVSGKVVFEGPISGRTVLRASADLATAERQALSVLAEDFAKNASSRLTEGAW